MAASLIILNDEEDDGFDWESAVQEIDAACYNAIQSACQSDRVHKNIRQSTLDQFINRGAETKLNDRIKKGKEVNLELEVEDNIEVDARGCFVDIDPVAAKTWIYPENVPIREYQLAITKKALFANTLVALPTGLGKTLIAAVVMYNYFRWFPEGKIVFTAPSRPLVLQQIEACHNIVGIPQEWTIDMTGQTSPAKRENLWKEKRVFFVTPQVFEKDIQSGTCLVQFLVCLVIDEAHRASGNFSYCVAVRELMAVPVQLRILALTATPGSKQQAIQQVIDNLQISTLEYRNESDPDVSPYVHDRKLELIEVPLGRDALEINNLLWDAIRPLAARLLPIGVLPNRDPQTLSPIDLLNSRDMFRNVHAANLTRARCGEVEGCFNVLITLYHIRKLLSSHGIRPAYEMLEGKLKAGGQMSRNECIHQVKVLMRRSMTNGAPSPKLSKLIEVLADHYKNNDPERSRVIIFSNFRESVRDIMEALSNLGNTVRPAEFIGQSSGKTCKGQTQKEQQAVLEKFRNGGYNVIVATCIGEEGLDIVEVNLVICFDANVSPLRMIQRMGRTGRKNDGRVVILACEGPELKGYMRKQATGKAVRKHMRNGGMNSFNFHPSPRMVPHIYRPEQKCLQLSIPEFVPRGKKVKDDSVPELNFEEKLTDAEALTLSRYFSNNYSTWKPSLIAFPQFQALPSRVHMVKHSSRTVTLIDAMQNLQGKSCTWNKPSPDPEDYPGHCTSVGHIEKVNDTEEECFEVSNAEVSLYTSGTIKLSVPNSPKKDFGTTNPASVIPFGKDRCAEPESIGKLLDSMVAPVRHICLFSSELASVDSIGRIVVAPIPILTVKEVLYSESPSARNSILKNCPRQVKVVDSDAICEVPKELHVQTTVCASLSSPVESSCENMEGVLRSQIPLHSKIEPVLKVYDESCMHDRPNAMMHESPELLGSSDDDGELDLSPRLTNFIISGCVPESPINVGGEEDNEMSGLEPKDATLCALPVPGSVKQEEQATVSSSPCARNTNYSLITHQPCTPLLKAASNGISAGGSFDAAKEVRTPLANVTNTTCSTEWYMSSAEKSASAKRTCKFKRLRKIGDTISCNGVKENSRKHSRNPAGKYTRSVSVQREPDEGALETFFDVRDLILVEAEVSSEVEVSADEEDDQNNDTYDDSFIDDRVDPTMATQEPLASEIDMMTIYRRSLLTQSPIIIQNKHPRSVTPESLASTTSLDSCNTENSFETPQGRTKRDNISSRRKSVCSKLEKIAEEARPSTSGTIQIDDTSPAHSRKRKFSCGEIHVPAINLEKEFSAHSESLGKGSSPQGDKANPNDPNWDFYMDDEFYESLDLDALEAQATKLLLEKAGSSAQKPTVAKPIQPKDDNLGFPSFDLGIS